MDGVYIHLPSGSVEVNTACAGVDLICYMLAMGVLAISMFPLRKSYSFSIVIFAVFLAFFVNSLRVGLMVILVSRGNIKAFDYMHEGEGSLVFGMIAVTVFAAFYWLLMNKAENIKSKSTKIKESPLQGDSFF